MPYNPTEYREYFNFLFNEKELPSALSSFLIEEQILTNNKTDGYVRAESYLIAEYIYSNNYLSYLVYSSEDNSEEDFETKDVYMINVKSDTILSIGHVASYFLGVQMAPTFKIFRYSKVLTFLGIFMRRYQQI